MGTEGGITFEEKEKAKRLEVQIEGIGLFNFSYPGRADRQYIYMVLGPSPPPSRFGFRAVAGYWWPLPGGLGFAGNHLDKRTDPDMYRFGSVPVVYYNDFIT